MGVRNRTNTILVKNLTDFDEIFIHHILFYFFSNYILLNASFVKCTYVIWKTLRETIVLKQFCRHLE